MNVELAPPKEGSSVLMQARSSWSIHPEGTKGEIDVWTAELCQDVLFIIWEVQIGENSPIKKKAGVLND